MRARRAVSHFAVGSAALSPGVRLGGHGLYACGDWVDRTGHASWSTEKAVVTGRQAAAAVAADLKLRGVDSAVPISPYISTHLPVSPCISLYLPASPYISLQAERRRLGGAARRGLHLPVSPCTSLQYHLPVSPRISPPSPHYISQVLPAEADTAPLATLRTLAGGARAAALGSEALPPPAPWAALRAMLPRP